MRSVRSIGRPSLRSCVQLRDAVVAAPSTQLGTSRSRPVSNERSRSGVRRDMAFSGGGWTWTRLHGVSGGRRVRLGQVGMRWSFVVIGVPAVALLVGQPRLVALLSRSAAVRGRPARAVVFGGFGFVVVDRRVPGRLVGSSSWCRCVRLTHLVEGPEHRLQQSLRRIRGGDLSFRVSLRRVAISCRVWRTSATSCSSGSTECPPAGARTGGDVVDVAEQDEEGEP
jgi:hypothetical protein